MVDEDAPVLRTADAAPATAAGSKDSTWMSSGQRRRSAAASTQWRSLTDTIATTSEEADIISQPSDNDADDDDEDTYNMKIVLQQTGGRPRELWTLLPLSPMTFRPQDVFILAWTFRLLKVVDDGENEHRRRRWRRWAKKTNRCSCRHERHWGWWGSTDPQEFLISIFYFWA